MVNIFGYRILGKWNEGARTMSNEQRRNLRSR